jgi:hypothetical protein
VSKAKVTTTVTEEVKLSPKLERQILTELQGYAACHAESKALKAGADEHRNNLFALADANVDADSFQVEGFKIAVVRNAIDRRLDKQKLVKRLVKDKKYTAEAAMALLADCTTDKPKKDHVRVTVPGEESSDE